MKGLTLKNVKFEGVRLFLLNLQQQVKTYKELVLYLMNDGENGFIQADIKHDSLHHVKICEANEILSENEEVTIDKVLAVLELLASELYDYCYEENVDCVAIETSIDEIREGLRKADSLLLPDLVEDEVSKFMIKLKKIWEEELSDFEELYLMFDYASKGFVVKPFASTDEEAFRLSYFIELGEDITRDDVLVLTEGLQEHFIECNTHSLLVLLLNSLEKEDVSSFFETVSSCMEHYDDEKWTISFDYKNKRFVATLTKRFDELNSCEKLFEISDYVKQNRIDDFINKLATTLFANDLTKMILP